MPTPTEELKEPRYGHAMPPADRSSDEEGTVVGENAYYRTDEFPSIQEQSSVGSQHLHINTNTDKADTASNLKSPSQTREQAHRLDDDLRMLQVERQVSAQIDERPSYDSRNRPLRSATRERSHRSEPVDDFDVATNPLHERTQIYRPPEHPSNTLGKIFKHIHNSSPVIRYFTYIIPITLIVLIPLLIGALVHPIRAKKPNVGGVELLWFCIWLEIVWLTLWAGRIVAKLLPAPVGLLATLFTNNAKKWRDMTKQLEVPATLFFWMLAVELSFLPLMRNHQVRDGNRTQKWQTEMNKVIVSFFVLAILNFIEKIIIQLIAISFHLRTYQDRIELNKFQIGSLVKLYQYSKNRITLEDSDFEQQLSGDAGAGSGARTPAYIEKATKATKEGFNKFGDVAGKIAGDFTGRDVKQSGHPHQVVLSLLATTGGSQVLARRLYRTFGREETQTVFQEDLTNAFENQDEADAAFSMFDKDMNGDISMEELEAVCVEIGRERKSITASLKDLDSVVGKLDNVFTFIIVVVAVLVFISLISTSAAGVLTSAGSAVLALSWLFSTTAQEFLQSVIFVFVKHPFDVGDRVTVYGNTGTTLKGDDYFVKEISLLYTEFKKLEGHVVQAPNSYLNTLFILNMRRSGGLAEAIPMTFKYGTTLEQIEGLRNKLLEFVKAEKREYQANILTELREIEEVHAINLNVIFFFKSNWQNELLRLQRRNKFICAMMVAMQELKIEGPRMRFPGQRENFPLYMQNLPFQEQYFGQGGTPDDPMGSVPHAQQEPTASGTARRSFDDRSSIARSSLRPRGESLAAMGKRYDFSLGMSSIPAGDLVGDVHRDREASRARIPVSVTSPSPLGRTSHDRANRDRATSLAQTSARSISVEPGHLVHRGTAPAGRTSSSLHRNRFFGRKSHDSERMEAGMAGIPEGEEKSSHLDPRSGLISPAAVRRGSEEGPVSGQETTMIPPLPPTSTHIHDFSTTK